MAQWGRGWLFRICWLVCALYLFSWLQYKYVLASIADRYRSVPVGTDRYRSPQVPVSTSAGTGPARQNCSQLSGGSGVGIPNVQKWGNSQ